MQPNKSLERTREGYSTKPKHRRARRSAQPLAEKESSSDMGHFVTGIIIKESDAEAVASRIPFKKYFLLKQGIVIFPLTDDLLDEKIPPPQDFCFEEFTYLPAELAHMISGASAGMRIAYIE